MFWIDLVTCDDITKDLKIKLSEMYLKIDLRNLAYSLIGVFVYLFLLLCLKF